ncbi:hypothetical protein EVAR_42960_1 [Eumeta japonica]|uniref:FLYWCH-type domain-containing protein n=1 Tax=Eumeta variegata TaxID=151549 RepID=A0A4C1YCP7_EUMVA|nr:hypothetical protein EVAR_42960_1 [Eumeta japonica]
MSSLLYCRVTDILAQYSWSRQGNAIILLGDYRFKKRSKHMNQRKEMHWVCNQCDKGCRARLTTLDDAIIRIHNVHQHDGIRK